MSAETPRPNRLANETSPYLLQHRHNPVDWHPWGPEAIDKARQEGKPIFLSIGYAACHWCHVMERESFENEEVARFLNENFVSIKVDREERPDVDEIYMAATQVLSGSGGWPMSVFLTPDLKPFFAGTYFPPSDMHGRPGFPTLLRALNDAWQQRPEEVRKQAEQLAEAVRGVVGGRSGPGRLDRRLLSAAAETYKQEFDPVHGGFGRAPKFPPHARLELLLRQFRRQPTQEIRQMAELTLERMARGGIYDQIGGGFARYSVDERWLVPHFEKMLYDNAQLAPLYAEAARLFERPYFRRIAEQTLDFWLRELTHPDGGAFSSLDADSEGVEGKFTVWTPDEVVAVLGKEDGAWFNRLFDVTSGGNFEGNSIPNLLNAGLEELAEQEGVSYEALVARLDPLLLKLREARAQRVPPATDDKVLTAWNGLFIRALARVGRALEEPRYLDAARRAAEFALTHLKEGGRLRVTWREGQAKLNGYLDDYAFLAVGLLDLFEATMDVRWLEEARAMVDVLNERFWDGEDGGYFFTSDDHEELIARVKNLHDGALPSGNALAAEALVRLAELTGEGEYRRRAEALLAANASNMERLPSGFAGLLIAADQFLETGPPSTTSTGRVKASAAADPESVPAGAANRIVVRLEIEPGWHVNAVEAESENLVPTAVSVGQGHGFTAGDGEFPAGREVEYGGEPLRVYEGEVTLSVAMHVAEGTEPGRYGIPVRVRYQACSEKECLAPAEEELVAYVEVGEARQK